MVKSNLHQLTLSLNIIKFKPPQSTSAVYSQILKHQSKNMIKICEHDSVVNGVESCSNIFAHFFSEVEVT